jgi:hypothetical protein
MNLMNICTTTVLMPVAIPDTSLFVGEESTFSFSELKNTQNKLLPVPDCGELNVVVLFNGAFVDWIKLTTIGSHAAGNKVYSV